MITGRWESTPLGGWAFVVPAKEFDGIPPEQRWPLVRETADLSGGPAPVEDLQRLTWETHLPVNRRVVCFVPLPRVAYACGHRNTVTAPLCPECQKPTVEYRYAR